MTPEDFYNRICDLSQGVKRDLETYLLALLKLTEEGKEEEIGTEQFFQIIQQAFTSEALEFNPDWLNITKPPVDDTELYPGVNYTLAVLKFQIADLHKMRGKQLDNPHKYFGVTSESGNHWYNFDPAGNLECGVRCILDHDYEGELDGDWRCIGELLEMGRIYE